jgi:hypothetical protein
MAYGIESKYITDSRPASPLVATAASVYMSSTWKQCLATIKDSTIFTGVYIFNAHKHVKPIFSPKVVQLPGPPDTDTDQDILLVHRSNDPVTFHPELIPMDVVKWALVIVPSDATIPGPFWNHSVNKGVMPFAYADILPLLPGLANLLPSKMESYHLLALPASVPIMYGTDSMARGPV